MLSLAPVAVRPKFQNQGIGSQLVKAGLEIAEEMGESLVIVLGHPEFYPKFGFQPAKRFQIESSFEAPEEAWMMKPLNTYQEKYKGTIFYLSVFQSQDL